MRNCSERARAVQEAVEGSAHTPQKTHLDKYRPNPLVTGAAVHVLSAMRHERSTELTAVRSRWVLAVGTRRAFQESESID